MTQTNPLALAVDGIRDRHEQLKLSAAESAAFMLDKMNAGVWITGGDEQSLALMLQVGTGVVVNAFAMAEHPDSLWMYLVGAEALNGGAA